MPLMKRLMVLTAVAAVLVVGLVSVAAAQSGDDQGAQTTVDDSTPKLVEVLNGAAVGDPGDLEDLELLFDEDWEPSAEELAEINAETDALVEYLGGLGFEVTVETDELGFRYVDFDGSIDGSIDEAVFEAMEDFYEGLFADEVAGWSAEEKAEWNTGTDEFVAELAAEGITVETEEIAPGVYDIVWTDELEEALCDLDGHDDDGFFGDFDDISVEGLEQSA